MLSEIINYKREYVKRIDKLPYSRDKKILDPLEFLVKNPFICEIKKASPSLGEINIDLDIVKQAQNYTKFGAGAVSVLTDEKYFKGSYHDLKEISKSVNVPVLCKDFILSEIQIENAFLAGADMILLVTSYLDISEIKRLAKKASELGLEILFEIHDVGDFDKIKELDIKLLGVNSRNLKNLIIDKEKAKNILSKLKGDFLKIAESGIEDDILAFKESGANAFLIGTTLMRSKNIQKTFEEFYLGLE